MAVTTARIASGSTNGRGIAITSTTAGSGNILHTANATSSINTFDEVYVYAMNLTTLVRKLIINAGGTATGDKVRYTVPSSSAGLVRILPGFRYNNGVIVRAYATGAGSIACHVYVNRTA